MAVMERTTGLWCLVPISLRELLSQASIAEHGLGSVFVLVQIVAEPPAMANDLISAGAALNVCLGQPLYLGSPVSHCW